MAAYYYYSFITPAFAAFAAHACASASLHLSPAALGATTATRLLPRAAARRPRRSGPCDRARSHAIVCLNRLLLDPSECEVDGDTLVARLKPDDHRTLHVKKQLKAVSGQQVRAGVLDAGTTDGAVLHWEGDSSEHDTALRIELGPSAPLLRPLATHERPRIDLLLAMPRPLQFARLLPMISSMGIGTLWLTGAQRVERSYFSSHLLKDEREADRQAAILEGLEQSGDTAVPRFVFNKSLRKLLRDEFGAADEEGAPPLVKLVCHPERTNSTYGVDGATSEALRVRRLSDIHVSKGARVVLAVGPERGWEEPDELALLVSHGFQPVTLGPRTLRTDVAVISLLAVANDLLLSKDE